MPPEPSGHGIQRASVIQALWVKTERQTVEIQVYKPNPVHHLLWNKVLLEQMHDHLITYCLLTGFMLQWYSCYQSQAQLLAARKLVGETMVVGTEKLLLKSCWNLERRLD